MDRETNIRDYTDILDPDYVSSLGSIGDCGSINADCYVCGEAIPDDETNWGFTWGSDGVFPDGASAMYACKYCQAHWINPPQSQQENQ